MSTASRTNVIVIQPLGRKSMQGIERSKRGCEDGIKMVLKKAVRRRKN